MYLNMNGNVATVCVAVTKPEYREEVGEKRLELTKVFAKCREATPDGEQIVNVDLLFYSGMAIPAMRISPGMTLFVVGRESPKEFMQRGKMVLERSLYVTCWMARDIDPLGMLEELKARKATKTREQELKLAFWEFLNLPQIKELLFQWFKEFVEDYKKLGKADKSEKKEDEQQ